MAKPLTILILLLYYNRPKMVQGALASVWAAGSQYPHWHLAIHDDASDLPFQLDWVPSAWMTQVSLHRTQYVPGERLENGTKMGDGLNRILAASTADIAIMLCDDDALRPDYLCGLASYFQKHPDVVYAYSHILIYNPLRTNWRQVEDVAWRRRTKLNRHSGWVNPSRGRVSAAQMAWRVSVHRKQEIWFPYYHWTSTDAYLLQQLYAKFGRCAFTGLTGQCVGLHGRQLHYIDPRDAMSGAKLDKD